MYKALKFLGTSAFASTTIFVTNVDETFSEWTIGSILILLDQRLIRVAKITDPRYLRRPDGLPAERFNGYNATRE